MSIARFVEFYFIASVWRFIRCSYDGLTKAKSNITFIFFLATSTNIKPTENYIGLRFTKYDNDTTS